jgi:hypothetical protein
MWGWLWPVIPPESELLRPELGESCRSPDPDFQSTNYELEAAAQEKQHEEEEEQQEEELADEDASSQGEQQNDDEQQDEHAGSNRSVSGGEP